MNNNYLMERKINTHLELKLNHFLSSFNNKELDTPEIWRIFYLFVNSSFQESQSNRYSISQLALILKKEGISPGPYIKAYAHGLYILALNHGLEIYKNGFNI